MAPAAPEEPLLEELGRAIERSRGPVREIEVGLALSIALGRQRTPVSCGGCATGLEYRGIPARTNPRLSVPFRLILTDATASG
jgi:hypothetical protein